MPAVTGPCFTDLYELDFVIGLLREDISAIEHCPGYDPLSSGPIRPLASAIEAQKRWQREENEHIYPGAFDRSYLIDEYGRAEAILQKALFRPRALSENIDDLIISLYRLMIIGNMSADQLRVALSELADAKIDAKHGEKFKGRKPGSVGPIRKAIARLIKKNPSMKTADIWGEIAKKSPKGWCVRDNSQGKYIEGPKAGDEMKYRRFQNVVSEERKLIKSK